MRPFKVDSKGNEKKKNAPLSESEAVSLPESVLSSFSLSFFLLSLNNKQ